MYSDDTSRIEFSKMSTGLESSFKIFNDFEKPFF